ncbi:MAG: hypothetical protein WD231_00845 [Candidatus Woykebacteria bacterium]
MEESRLTKNGQALIELVIGFGIVAIVLTSVSLLLVSTRESRERAANVLAAETSSLLQGEAMRSVRESGWSKLTNGTYHIEPSGREYSVSICQTSGCQNGVFTQDTDYSFGPGQLDVNFPQYTPLTPQAIVEVWVLKTSNCGGPLEPLSCFAFNTISSLKLTGLNPGIEERVSICPQGGCTPSNAIADYIGTPGSSGELTATFPPYTPTTIVEIWVIKTNCSLNPLLCFSPTYIQNMTLSGLDPAKTWRLETGSETVGNFTRQVEIGDACRDSSNNLVTCPSGTIDTSTKKITSNVSWTSFFGGNIQNTFYLTRTLGNTTWVQTTQADFNSGTLSNTETTSVSGGEVQLKRNINWGNPQSLANYDNSGNGNGVDTFVLNNYAYVGIQDAGSAPDFAIINVSNPASPVVTGTLNLTADVNGISVEDSATSGQFAYLATSHATEELTVINISNKAAPAKVATLDLGDAVDALDITVQGSGRLKFAYITKQSSSGTARELYIASVNTCFDVTGDNRVDNVDIGTIVSNVGMTGDVPSDINGDKIVSITDVNLAASRFGLTCPHTPNPNVIGSFEVGNGPVNANAVYGVTVVGNRAYLATARDDKELMVVDITNKTLPTEIGSYNAASNSDGSEVFVNSNTAYLATQNNGSGPEFNILNVTNPASISLVSNSPPSTYNVGSNVNGVWIAGNIAFLATTVSNKEFLLLNVQTPSAIAELGSRDLDGDANGIFFEANVAFLATVHNSRELQIVGPGIGPDFAGLGTFESRTFDAGSNVGFNRVTWSENAPPLTTNIKFQIASLNSDGPWLSSSFVGPDGTSATYFDSPGAIPLALVSKRHFRYKVEFSGNGIITPVLQDVIVNYSP